MVTILTDMQKENLSLGRIMVKCPAKSVDSRFEDKYGEIVLGLDKKGKIVN